MHATECCGWEGSNHASSHEIPGSILNSETSYPDCFSWLSSVLYKDTSYYTKVLIPPSITTTPGYHTHYPLMKNVSRNIGGSHSGIAEYSSLLGCNTVSLLWQ